MKKNYLYLIKSFMACALLCSAAYAQAQTKPKDLSKPQTQVKGYYTSIMAINPSSSRRRNSG